MKPIYYLYALLAFATWKIVPIFIIDQGQASYILASNLGDVSVQITVVGIILGIFAFLSMRKENKKFITREEIKSGKVKEHKPGLLERFGTYLRDGEPEKKDW